MDPLSDVLSLLKPSSYVTGGFEQSGAWSIQFPQHKGVKCYSMLTGQCWLCLDDVAEPVRLHAGDCFLLPLGRSFTLSSDPGLAPVDFRVVKAVQEARKHDLASGGGAGPGDGSECFIAGGHFLLEGQHASVLLGTLPPIVHIQKESDRAAMRWSLERMRQELREPQPGGSLVTQQLAYMMLIQALRLYLADGSKGGVGWMFALADRQMNAAMSAMHGEPAHRWTLQALAERSGMSRSTFALKFKEIVGTAPMEYLTRWRMLLAGDRLTHSGEPVSAIALSLGYESESAFSTAFKRVMGCSPRQYSRGKNLA
jgi:AraC-like DNA-binding protein